MDPRDASASQVQVEAFSRRHRTGLVTLLFSDIVGSTQLKQALGDREGVALIQNHHALVREVLSAFPEAEEISTAGDSFFIVFAKPSEAVRFALLLQARLRALAEDRAGSHPGPEFQGSGAARLCVEDRIGIHAGEVVIEEATGGTKAKDVYGLHVDACARVMALAGPGQILMTRFVFDNARQVLRGVETGEAGKAGALRWLNHGLYLFKGLEWPLEVCEVRMGPEGPVIPPPSTEKAQRFATADEEPVLGWRPALGERVPGTQWLLEEKLGEGGFGEVWRARHEVLKEQRVFKFCFRADRVRSLKREMTLFRLLKERVGDHPRVVRLQEVYFDAPPYYLEMEYVPGRDLRRWGAEQGGVAQVPLDVRLEIVAQAAEGLAAAHEAGVIHRDIKPGNILISGQWSVTSDKNRVGDSSLLTHPSSLAVKLTDFGIGQVVSQEYLAGLTRAGFTQTIFGDGSSSRTGTQMYMAPELLEGKPATVRSDLYSLGVVLYQLVVGDLARAVTTDWADEISDPLLTEDLRRCFAGRPEGRFGSAAELAKRLRSLPERRAELGARRATDRAGDRPAPKPAASIAVLPFANLSGDKENEYFSDGLAEEIINALTRVPGLRVTARTSAFAFRGQDVDVRDIGARLGVDHVLEGSVRRASNRLRITAQLIQVTDGCHVWSERYDRELTDVFALQDELAQAISDRLRPELAGDRRLVKTPTANVEAYQLYLQGRYHFCKMSPEGFARGRQCFEQAIAADPEFALAYDSLSELFWYLGFFGLMPPKDAFSKSVWATLRSLEIDDTLAEAHALLGMLRKELDYNWPEVQREFQRALELNPASPVVRLRYALSGLMPLGRVDQAAQELEGVLQSDPLSLFARWCLALMYYLGGRLDLALQQAQQMLEVDSTYAPAYWSLGTGYEAKGRFEDAVVAFQKYFELSGGLSANLGWLGWIYGRAGNETKARATLAELETRSQVSYVPPSSLAWTHLGLGEFDSAFACWAKAIEVRDPHIIPFKTYPFLAPLRSDPRYRELLRTMNLEP